MAKKKKGLDAQYAYGMGLLIRREAAGENIFHKKVLSVTAEKYLPYQRNLYIRPTAHIFLSYGQPEVPHIMTFDENDIGADIDIGLLYDWLVIPSLNVGLGGIYRFTSFTVKDPVHTKTDLSDFWFLAQGYVQFGVGIPIERGLLVLEPFGRYNYILGDARSRWNYGLRLTLALIR